MEKGVSRTVMFLGAIMRLPPFFLFLSAASELAVIVFGTPTAVSGLTDSTILFLLILRIPLR